MKKKLFFIALSAKHINFSVKRAGWIIAKNKCTPHIRAVKIQKRLCNNEPNIASKRK